MTYRIVQWVTGAKGMFALREVIRHPDLELAGLYVYDPEKVGKDAGDLAGVESTGVVATNRIDDILRLDADCVLYMAQMKLPFAQHDDNVCRLLESRKNVLALTGYYWPLTHGEPMSSASRRPEPYLEQGVSEVRITNWAQMCGPEFLPCVQAANDKFVETCGGSTSRFKSGRRRKSLI